MIYEVIMKIQIKTSNSDRRKLTREELESIFKIDISKIEKALNYEIKSLEDDYQRIYY